jgi:hypothetical protein
MKLGKMVGILSLLSVVLIGFVIIMMYFNYTNQDASLRNLIAAKQKSNENHYDAMWKIISQMAQVKDEYKADFKDVYGAIMDGRYQGEKGTLMLWIKEHNPEFDSKIYMKLMTAIEANRKEFMYNQDEILNMKKEHDNLRKLAPSRWFVANNEIHVKTVTSTKTMEVFSSEKDDDVQLFKRPAK